MLDLIEPSPLIYSSRSGPFSKIPFNMKSKTLKVLALGGMAGPILFSIVVIISAYFRPDYGHLHNFISELGASNTSGNILMNFGGFILSGLLICSFAIALLKITPKHFLAKLGASLIFIFGFGMMLAGIFSCDTGCPSTGSIESIIHDRVSAVTFFSSILGILLLGFWFRKTTIFKSISLYTIFTGILSAILLVAMINSFESRLYTGLWQRLLLTSIFIWTFVVALHIYRTHSD